LDPQGRSQKATLVVVVVVVVVISSIKIPKAFLICSGAQQNFSYIRAHIPYRSTVSDFQPNSRYHFCDQSLFHVIDLKLDIEPSLNLQLHHSSLLQHDAWNCACCSTVCG